MAHTVSKTITDATLNKIIQIESAGRPKAKATTSSATGLFQFLSATWRATVKKHRPDLMVGRSVAALLALRNDPALSIELGARFTEDNARVLGAGWTDGDIYLAHFSGVGVARKLLRAPESDPCSRHYSAAAIKANRSILEGKTVGQVRTWANKKMAAAGKTDWVSKYFKKTPIKKAALLAEDDAKPVKIESDVTDFSSSSAPHGEESPEILSVQKSLKSLGYFEIGLEDGKWGGRTSGAIAAFRNDRHLPGAAVIDDELTAELKEAEFEGWKRPITEKRADATPAEVQKETGVIVPQKAGVISGALTAAGGFFVWLFNSVLGAFGDAWNSDVVIAVREFAADNLGILAAAVGLVGGLALFKSWSESKAAEKKVVEAYQEGRLT